MMKAASLALAAQMMASASATEYTCDDLPADYTADSETWKVMGTSLGGQFVLEPWITPSLFYQFLGADAKFGPDIEEIKKHTGMDHKSFCTALGPKEANKQLRRHWKLWVTEEHIKALAAMGTNTLRIPVGDWMWSPYDVYAEMEDGIKCNDGAVQELDRVLALIHKYGMKALIDMHAWKGSQNGLDNSGETKHVKWVVEYQDHTYAPLGTFDHWKYKGWDWIISDKADWGNAMNEINWNHWEHTIKTLHRVVEMYKDHPAVWGIAPVNEVGMWTPMDVLQKFYWQAYWIARNKAPHWMVVLDASFRGGAVAEGGFMKGCRNKAVDKHPYHAWAGWGKMPTYYERSCSWAAENELVEDTYQWPVISGEWSLAIDTCAMWLLGFNDMQPGEPRAICDMIELPPCYTGDDQPGCPLDLEEGLQGPFGSGISSPMFGRGPRGMALGTKEDEYMTNLAHKQVHSFNEGHGWFFWNFRTEFEPHWDFLEAYRRGWFPKNVSDHKALKALDVCSEEDAAAAVASLSTGVETHLMAQLPSWPSHGAAAAHAAAQSPPAGEHPMAHGFVYGAASALMVVGASAFIVAGLHKRVRFSDLKDKLVPGATDDREYVAATGI